MDKGSDRRKVRAIPTASAILDDGSLVELVCQADKRRTHFALFNAGSWTLRDHVDIAGSVGLAPFSPANNLIKNEVVLLASEPRIYGSESELVADIQQFIHRYVDFSPTFERVATYYVLLTWLYDAFNDLPYLRLRGDFGSGADSGPSRTVIPTDRGQRSGDCGQFPMSV
jgi:hypothetical protein